LREVAVRPDIMTSEEADLFFELGAHSKDLTLMKPIEADASE
jgi:hypothetical protein